MTRKKTNKAQDVSEMLSNIDANSYTPFIITDDNAAFITNLLQQNKNMKENVKMISRHIFLFLTLYARQLRLYDQFDYFTSQMLTAMTRVPRMVQNPDKSSSNPSENPKPSEEAPNHVIILKTMLESGLIDKLVSLFFQHEAELDVSICILQAILGILQDLDLHYGLYDNTVQLDAFEKEVEALGKLLVYLKEDFWPQKAKEHLDLSLVITSIVWIFDHNFEATNGKEKLSNGVTAQEMFHDLLERYKHDAAKVFKVCNEVSYEIVSSPLLHEHPEYICQLLQDHWKNENLALLLFRILLNCLTVDILQHLPFITQLVQSTSMMKFTWDIMKRLRKQSNQSQLFRYVTAFFLLLLFLDNHVFKLTSLEKSGLGMAKIIIL